MRYFFLLLFCFGYFFTYAQFETGVTFQQLDSILYGTNPDNNGPGMGVIVIKDDSIVYFSSSGYANVKKELPIGLHTQYNIGSVTKMFTGIAILLLEEEGKLNRNDDIHKYVPEFPDYGQPITINQLLSHTSGIRDQFELASFLYNYNKQLFTFDGMVKYQQAYPELNAPVGESFAYSNAGYMLLAMVIEKASGLTYSTYLTQNIFIPLGMQNTYVSEGKEKYLKDGTGNYPLSKKGKAHGSFAYADAIGATGVNSTLYDMYLWDKNFYNNQLGAKNQALIDTLQKTFSLNNGNNVYYGCGIIKKPYRGKAVYEHSGGWGEYLTQYRRFPDEHISIIAWNNAVNYSPFVAVDKVSNAIMNYPATETKTYVLPGFNQKLLEGVFITENNFIREVKLKGDTLILRLPLNKSTRYHALTYTGKMGNTIYYTDSLRNAVEFVMINDTVTEFSWIGGEYFLNKRFYNKIEDSANIPVENFTGKYYLQNHNNKVKVIYRKYKHQLYLRNFPFNKLRMENICGNIYYMVDYDMYLRVEDDAIVIGDDWIFNLRYDKM